MSRYVNGVKMGFALSAYVNDKPKSESTPIASSRSFLQPAIKFNNLEKCRERSFNDYGDIDGCDDFECEVSADKEVYIYVDGEVVYGPVEGGSTIEIL